MGVRLSVEVNRKDRSVRGTAELKGFTFVMVTGVLGLLN